MMFLSTCYPPPTNPKTPNQTHKNVALITSRRFCQSQKSGVGFVSNKISDLRTWTCPGMEGGDYVNPLYHNPNYTENFTPEFRSFIDKHYSHHFEPLEVLGYIYALLYSSNYRTTASVMKIFLKPITLKSFSQTIRICLGF